MTTLPIPDAVLAAHTAVLGKTGSGKTSTEKLLIEHVVAQGARVCVLDTIKSDWWGITSSASGKHAGLPFKILGGPHGHVPLHSSAGKVIGQLVGSGKLPLSIVDMADFEPGGIQRFFVDFAQALFRYARGVVYLVIEEAHEVAPKERAGFGAENMAIHWAKKLATGARSKGIRLIVATQRVQQLHNGVLDSCETLIAHRLTTPASQEPVVKWMKANAEKATQDEVATSLSSLPTGTAWVCSGEAKFFQRVKFPKFHTYDNTVTPTGDGADVAVKTAPVDADELRGLIGEAVKAAEASDPKALAKAVAERDGKIRTLEQQLAAKAAPASDPAALEQAQKDGFAQAEKLLKRGAEVGLYEHKVKFLGAIADRMAPLMAFLSDELKAAKAQKPDLAITFAPAPAMPQQRTALPVGKASLLPKPPSQVKHSAANGSESADIMLTGVLLDTLKALAWWRTLGIEAPTRSQLGAMIKVQPSGSTMRGRLAALSKVGLIAYPSGATVCLTDEGAALAPAPDTGASLIETIRASLSGAELETFDAIPPAGQSISREDLGATLNVEATGSTMRGRLAALSRRELVHYPNGRVARQDWVV